jgi:glycosyltransferase involved in cell wall biosynthesis/peptidoglycan/xylan/chitin deacetylase (PgdA/CDA1 family)
MLRIGLLMDHPSPHMAGFLEALAGRHDCAVQVVYFRPSAPGRNWGNPVESLPHYSAAPMANRSGWRNIPAVLRAMARVRADLWVVNTCYTAPETWPGIMWLNARGVPWVYMNEPLRPRGRLDAAKTALLRLLLARATGVVGMGREAASRFAALTGDSKPLASVPYYVDLGEFLDLPGARARRGSMPVRFFTAGQLIARKGIDVLLAACARLPETGWSLTIAGDGPLRRELKAQFRRHRWADKVCFVGELPYERRAAAFNAHDVFVFPSRWDGWGVAPVEAMAAGMPVISTDQVMSMREFLCDGENGYVVASDDPAGLAERMQRFLACPEKIPAMGRAARAALSKHRPEFGADNLLRLLTTLDDARHRDTAADAPGGSLASREDGLTWQALSTPSRIRTRLHRKARALAKRAAIDMGLALPWRSATPDGHRILVYHLVLRDDRRCFCEHIRFLRDHYRLVCARELVERAANPDEPPLAAITFDDGFRAVMFDALELLETYGIRATFFVPTGFVQLASDPSGAARYSLWAHHYQRPLAPMTVGDLRQLRALGHEVGSHGASHLGMNAVSCVLGAAELESSRAQLAEWLGEEPAGFAYPYGEANSSVGEPPLWVAAAGYRYAVTSARGRVHAATDPMRLPREHVEGHWRLRDLRYFLSR